MRKVIFFLIIIFILPEGLFAQEVFSENREEQIKVLALKEDPADKHNNWILGEYRKDFYVIKHNEYVKNIWRFIKIYHGRVFFQNARTGEKGSYRIKITSQPRGDRRSFDLSNSVKVVSDKIQFSQALWLLGKIKKEPLIIGPGQNDYVHLNYINTNENEIIKELIKSSGYRMTKINPGLLVYTKTYGAGVGKLVYMRENEESDESIIWNFFNDSRSTKRVYLNNCSLKYAFQRIAQVSDLEYDFTQVRDDLTVSIFIENYPAKELLMALCAVAGVKIEKQGKKSCLNTSD